MKNIARRALGPKTLPACCLRIPPVKKRSPMSTRRNKRAGGALGRAAAVTLLFGIGMAISTAGHAAADFAGAWVVTKYSPELKTSDGRSPPLLPQASSLY